MDTRPQKYHQAALTYLVYGIIYLTGAIYITIVDGSSRGTVLSWFIIGVFFILIIPPLIWRGYKWFTRLIALLLIVRIVGLIQVIRHDEGVLVPLPWDATIPLTYGAVAFILVAAVTCGMLVRASFAKEVEAAEAG